jgi:hypothetical protein
MSRLGGVSLEFTGEFNEEGYSVTECLGGSMELSEEELGLRYQVRIVTPIILRVNLLTYLTNHHHLLRDLRVSVTPVWISSNLLVSPVSVPLVVLVINICWWLTLSLLDVAFLISNHFKNQRRGFDWDSRREEKGTADMLYSELGGKRVDA